MTFEATVYRVLVASPGDVGEERNVIPEVINERNAITAAQAKSLLMPVKWETSSAPLLGDRPQAIINQQLVKDCDLLVGVFWARIGTHTGVSVSGTAEEIEQFVALGKPVMLYFSESPINPDRIEIDQFTTLRNFKEKMRLKGLTESYSGLPDFRQKFGRQLAINLNGLLQKKLAPAAANSAAGSTKSAAKTSKVEGPARAGIPSLLESVFAENKQLSPAEINDYVVRAVTSTAREDGWANIAALGSYLRTYTPVDYKALGYQTLKSFLQSTKLFEIKSEQKSSRAAGLDSASVRLLQKG